MLVFSKYRPSGFTLVELLVVLAIVAAVGALTGPDLWSAYIRANERVVVIEYGRAISSFRKELMKARGSVGIAANTMQTDQSPKGMPKIEPGWRITSNSEIFFLPTGVTNGGTMLFESPTGRSWQLSLSTLEGKISVALL